MFCVRQSAIVRLVAVGEPLVRGSSGRFGQFGLEKDNPLHIDPRHSANRPELNSALTAILHFLVTGVVDELKDARLDVAATVE